MKSNLRQSKVDTKEKQIKQSTTPKTIITMCATTDSNNKENSKLDQMEQQQDHKLSVGETATLFGSAIARKANESKDTFVEALIGVKDGAIEIKDAAIEKTNEVENATAEKTDNARSYTADKIGNMKDAVEPPKPEPESKTITERIKEAVKGPVDAITSNIHVHPDEKVVLDGMQEKEEKPYPLGKAIQENANEVKKNIVQFGEVTKQTAQEKADNARSWTADQLGGLKKNVEPSKHEEEDPKTLGDRLQYIKESITSKLEDYRAGNDPHEDPRLRGDDNKPL
jgi:hypothetical protein